MSTGDDALSAVYTSTVANLSLEPVENVVLAKFAILAPAVALIEPDPPSPNDAKAEAAALAGEGILDKRAAGLPNLLVSPATLAFIPDKLGIVGRAEVSDAVAEAIAPLDVADALARAPLTADKPAACASIVAADNVLVT